MTLTQDKRIASLDTPLGKDVLVAASLRWNGRDQRAVRLPHRSAQRAGGHRFRPGNWQKLFLNIQNLRKKARPDLQRRTRASAGARRSGRSLQLSIDPAALAMAAVAHERLPIFKGKAPAIIEKVFRDRGFSDFRDGTSGSFPDLEYCVQYRETDLAFVSRLMEQHGIYYFFEHSKDKHTLVLADGKSSHGPVPGHAKLPFIKDERQARRDQDHVFRWSPERRFRSGKFELNDYDYLQPNANLISDSQGTAGYNKSDMEIYDYPGKFKEKNDGETYAKIRLQAEQAMDQRRYAEGNSISLFPGGLVTIEKHPKDSENKEYLILRASHSYASQSYRSGTSGNEETLFRLL